MPNVTIKDIAEAAGVSYSTVSRTINNVRGVNKATREKVLETAKSLGYTPNIHARSLKTNQTYTLALVVPDIANPFFSDIALAVNEAAYERGYNTILCSTNWDVDVENAHIESVLRQRVDGIILKPVQTINPLMVPSAIPSVIISSIAPETHTYIEVDNPRGGKEAAAHLLRCGYKRIAFIGGRRESSSNQDRLNGLRSEMERQNRPIKPEYIKYGPFTLESGYRCMKELMTLSQPPDAVFGGNDLIALGALQYLNEVGVRVPQDFGVIGFDDVYFSSLPQIQMSTIAQPRAQIGQLAAELLLQQVETTSPRNVQHVMLEPKLVIRKSTRAYASDKVKN